MKKNILVIYPSWQSHQAEEVTELLSKAADGKSNFLHITYLTEFFLIATLEKMNLDGVIWGWNWLEHQEEPYFELQENELLLKYTSQAEEFHKALKTLYNPSPSIFEGTASGIRIRPLIEFLKQKIALPKKMVSLSSDIKLCHSDLVPMKKPGGHGMSDSEQQKLEQAERIVKYFMKD